MAIFYDSPDSFKIVGIVLLTTLLVCVLSLEGNNIKGGKIEFCLVVCVQDPLLWAGSEVDYCNGLSMCLSGSQETESMPLLTGISSVPPHLGLLSGATMLSVGPL